MTRHRNDVRYVTNSCTPLSYDPARPITIDTLGQLCSHGGWIDSIRIIKLVDTIYATEVIDGPLPSH